MDLNELRLQIDDIDSQILALFLRRMEVGEQGGDYKQKNNLPVFHPEREAAILEKMASRAPAHLKEGTRELYATLMKVSKDRQYQLLGMEPPKEG